MTKYLFPISTHPQTDPEQGQQSHNGHNYSSDQGILDPTFDDCKDPLGTSNEIRPHRSAQGWKQRSYGLERLNFLLLFWGLTDKNQLI